MNGKYKWLMVLMVFAGTALFGQVPRKYIRSGNKKFKEGNFSEAEVKYRKAVEKNPDYYKGQFNLGDAMYEEKNMEEAGKLFNSLSESAKDRSVKSSALYNYGNTLLSQKKYKEAMEAFKKSLLLNPDNENAKYNYEYARKKMIQQQKKQQQKNKNKKNKDKNKKNKDKNKDKKNQDKNKDKQKQDKKNQDKNKDKQKQQQKPQDKKDKQQQKQQNKDEQGRKGDQQKKQNQAAKPQQMSKKDAQRMLNALKNDEKKTLQKLQKKKAKAAHAKKSDIDW